MALHQVGGSAHPPGDAVGPAGTAVGLPLHSEDVWLSDFSLSCGKMHKRLVKKLERDSSTGSADYCQCGVVKLNS